MFPDFMPSEVYSLENRDSIFIASCIQRDRVSTPISQTDIATAYVKLGTNNEDPPILLLHGFDSSLLEFRHLIPLLKSRWETWAVDLLGFGFTERLPQILYNPNTIREHLYHFWQTAIARPVIVVGVSMGGAAAIDLALTHPKAVAKLILINSVGYNGSFEIGSLLPKPMVELGVEFWRQRRIQSLFWGKRLLDSRSEDAIRCASLPSFMPYWDKAINDFARSGGYYRLERRIPFLDKPTLIMWGEKDDVLGIEAASRFNDAIAGSKLVWLPQMGHSPQWSAPELVARYIGEFV